MIDKLLIGAREDSWVVTAIDIGGAELFSEFMELWADLVKKTGVNLLITNREQASKKEG